MMNSGSKSDFFVACKQIISQLESEILSRIESHFLSEFRPLTFQLRIFHDRKEFVFAIKKDDKVYSKGHYKLDNVQTGRQKEESATPLLQKIKHRSIE